MGFGRVFITPPNIFTFLQFFRGHSSSCFFMWGDAKKNFFRGGGPDSPKTHTTVNKTQTKRCKFISELRYPLKKQRRLNEKRACSITIRLLHVETNAIL